MRVEESEVGRIDPTTTERLTVYAHRFRRNEKQRLRVSYVGPRSSKEYSLLVTDEGLALSLVKDRSEETEEEVS